MICSLAKTFGRYPSLAAESIIREPVKKELNRKGCLATPLVSDWERDVPMYGSKARCSYDARKDDASNRTKHFLAEIETHCIRLRNQVLRKNNEVGYFRIVYVSHASYGKKGCDEQMFATMNSAITIASEICITRGRSRVTFFISPATKQHCGEDQIYAPSRGNVANLIPAAISLCR